MSIFNMFSKKKQNNVQEEVVEDYNLPVQELDTSGIPVSGKFVDLNIPNSNTNEIDIKFDDDFHGFVPSEEQKRLMADGMYLNNSSYSTASEFSQINSFEQTQSTNDVVEPVNNIPVQNSFIPLDLEPSSKIQESPINEEHSNRFFGDMNFDSFEDKQQEKLKKEENKPQIMGSSNIFNIGMIQQEEQQNENNYGKSL